METEGLQRIGAAEAEALLATLPMPLLPATLHAGYVEADARRMPGLVPTHLVFRRGGDTWLHALHVSDIGGTRWRDASSPYGYGGPVSSSDDAGFVQAAWRAYRGWMREQRVVVEYVRFHPVLCNERHYGGHVEDNREVVMLDLTGDFAAGYAPRLRQLLKKAEREAIAYAERPLGEELARFGAYYRASMQAMQADPFYGFEDAYFAGLAETGRARLGLCMPAGRPDTWLAAALFLEGRGVREYHLAATTPEGRKCGASSFVLHRAAQAARSEGLQCFYLGGGSDRSADNSLLFFKGGFATGRWPYRTGWTVFDEAAYAELQQRFPEQWAAHPERPIFYRKV